MNKKIIAIDGNSLIHRAYHGMPFLSNQKGQPTQAIFGFLKMILNLIKKEKPDGLVVAFDIGKTFRHKLYPEYKGQRKEMDEDLKTQFPIIKELLIKMGIPILSIENYEADDILGSVAVLGKKNKDKIILVTGDKDSFQLINDDVSVFFTKKGISNIEKLNPLTLMENYGLKAKHIIDIKALEGDCSDNIKGIKGIGKKTAFELITKYDNLENLYKNLNKLKDKIRQNLILFKEKVFFNKKLITIKTNISINYNGFCYGLEFGDSSLLKQLLIDLNFDSIISEFKFSNFLTLNIKNKKKSVKNIKKNIYKKIDLFLNNIKKKIGAVIAVYFLTNKNKEIEFISLFDGEKEICFTNDFPANNITKNILINLISLKKKLLFFESKSFFHLLYKNFLNTYKFQFEDISLMSYLINPEKIHTIDSIILESKNNNLIENYYSQNLWYIYNALMNELKNCKLNYVYEKIEKKLVPILVEMENHGVGLNKKTLKKMKNNLEEKINILIKNIYSFSEEKFNINSTKQLTKILFEKLKLPLTKKNKTGYSTNQDSLEKLKDKHLIINLILKYRKLTKLLNTYIKGFISLIDYNKIEKIAIINTKFNQTVVSTGRLSSENPNLQNIPIRMPEGKLIRKAFVPINSNNYFISSDYSQIELRILAHISNDKNLKFAFNNEIDVHAQTASEIFDISIKNVTEEMRRKAKAVNFGIIYGISEFGLSKDLDISIKEAKNYIETYFKKYPKIRLWIDNLLIESKKNFKVNTITGRYRILSNLKSNKFLIRSAAERMAMNAPIQGTAADLIKIAMIDINEEIKQKKLKTYMVLQVHDELIFEVPSDEIEIIIKILKDKMINAMNLSVPLKINLKIGKNWYDMKKIIM